MSKHIVIIGGGPAGYEAALYGAAAGASITLIENHKIGGTCLNYGCIPTKTLVENASFISKIKTSNALGVVIPKFDIDYEAITTRKMDVIQTLQKGIMAKLKKAKVTYIEGHGVIKSKQSVEVNETVIKCDKILLCTGSKPIIPSFISANNKNVITSKELLEMTSYPSQITIVGGGVIGMEFASILNSFGTDVTILEYATHLLPTLDSAIGKRLKSICSKEGMTIVCNAKVKSIENDQILYEGKKGDVLLDSPCILVAVGRQGSYDKAMCDMIGIEHNDRFVYVDDQLATNIEHIYAIGDVNGRSLLAHSAYDQGRQVIDHIMSGTEVVRKLVPACVFVSPEIATIGISESEAKERGLEYRVEKTLYSSSGKALAMNEGTGFIKSIVNQDGHLIGLHILGVHASDLIHYGSIAMENNLSVGQLQKIIFAHPSIGELFSDNIHQY